MANIITGTEAADALQGTAGDDTVSALGDHDNVEISRGHDSIDGGTGHDTLFLYSPLLALPAGPRSYTITADRLTDGSGAIDTYFTAIESIRLTDTGTGGVTIDGSAAGLWLTLTVAAGIHDIIGGALDDDLAIKGGWGVVDGGGGNDWLALTVDASANGSTLVGTQAGGATVWSRSGGDSLTTRNIEMTLFAATGGALRVDASAVAGPVRFEQSAFADSFVGSAGDDMVTTGTGASGTGDVLTGGGGTDTYYFKSFAGFGGATIADFSEQDAISLLALPVSTHFIGTAAFSGTVGEVRFVRGANTTQLIGDANGDGIGESILTLTGSFQLAETGVGTKDLRRVPDAITGTEGVDIVVGSTADQTVHLLGGFDEIYISRGHDVLDGGVGGTGNYGDWMQFYSDLLALPAGPHHYTLTADRLSDATGLIDTSFTEFERISVTETSGEDVTFDAGTTGLYVWMYLTTGAHQVTTGAGNDQVSVIDGSGVYDGGAGAFDTLSVRLDNSANANTIYASQTGATTTISQAGRADLSERNFESFEIAASSGAMRIDASATLRGLTIATTALADTIVGGAGNDHVRLAGSGVGDVFTGGAGADWYEIDGFAALNGARITDFAREDRLDLHLVAMRFIGTAAFSGAAGEVRYEASGGQTRLIGDADGDGVGDSVLTLSNREMTLRERALGSKELVVGPEQITGTEAGETLFGTTFADELRALGGNDTIKVSGGIDSVDGGAGTDTLELDASLLGLAPGPHSYTILDNKLFDGSGAVDTSFIGIERLRVADGFGSDVSVNASALTLTPLMVSVLGGAHNLIGGGGGDSFSVGGGSGTVDGRGGADTLFFTTDFAANANPLKVTPSSGATILAQAGGPSLTVRNIETIRLSARVGSGLNVDASAAGVPLVFGLSAMADTAIGGAGADLFEIAGSSNGMGDVLTGGGGADIFSFFGLGGFSGATITDLSAEDSIKLVGLTPNISFIGAAEFSGAGNAEYRYLAGNGLTGLLADMDGDGEVDSAMLISNGAFVLAETGYGSGILQIVGQMPANDAGPNMMTGTEARDYLDSGAGDDVIDARGGDDIVNAGEGNDQVLGGAGADAIHGGDGNDIIDGAAGQDYLYGDDGDDRLTDTGGSGDPMLAGWLTGGFGNDTLLAANGVYRLIGDNGGSTDDDGDDRLTLTGGMSGSTLDGGGGNDVIRATGSGTLTLLAGNGDDDVTIGGFIGGSVTLGYGNDTLRIQGGGGYSIDLDTGFTGGTDTVLIQSLTAGISIRGMNGGEQGDVLDLTVYGANPFGTGVLTIAQQAWGTVIQHVASGVSITLEGVLAANLSAHNLRVANPLYAPVGLTLDDTFADHPEIAWASQLTGADGDDTIRGYGGNDTLYGGGGADRLEGGEGSDLLDGGTGDDVLVDEAGEDWLIGGGGADSVTGGDGQDTLWGGEGSDLLIGGDGDDVLTGGAGIDTVSYADAGAGVEIDLSILEDQQTRGAGTDTLQSIENLIGSAFDDVLAGNSSANLFRGGAGNDRFVFDRTILTARDGIVDFAAGDVIDIRAVEVEGGDPDCAAFTFLGDAAFTGGNRQLRVTGSGTSWTVQGDLDGDGVADFTIDVATVVPGMGLSASDFLL